MFALCFTSFSPISFRLALKYCSIYLISRFASVHLFKGSLVNNVLLPLFSHNLCLLILYQKILFIFCWYTECVWQVCGYLRGIHTVQTGGKWYLNIPTMHAKVSAAIVVLLYHKVYLPSWYCYNLAEPLALPPYFIGLPKTHNSNRNLSFNDQLSNYKTFIRPSPKGRPLQESTTQKRVLWYRTRWTYWRLTLTAGESSQPHLLVSRSYQR